MIKANFKKIIMCTAILIGICFFTYANIFLKKSISYFPIWAEYSKNNKPIQVLDTNSALGQYSTNTKELSLKDLVLIHGHMCDGLVISYIELKTVLEILFPTKIIDRTDIRVISKNGPCWMDAAAMITGARTNFRTLSIDKSLKNGFIVQKISTNECYKVQLKEGIFPEKLEKIEKIIRTKQKEGTKVDVNEIKLAEKEAEKFNKYLLNTDPIEYLDIKKVENFKYNFTFVPGMRSDVLNKNVN